MKFRPSSIAWILCILIGVLVALLRFTATPAPDTATMGIAGGDAVKAAFTLTDHNGQNVTEKSWPGKYLLVYFGFTHCPDVCPLGLNKIAEVLKQLPEDKLAKLQPIFITVDPARDSVKSLKEYVPLFHANIVGLTGTEAQTDAVKKAFRVYAEKSGDGPDYMINHSAFTYVMNPDGTLQTVFPHEATADEIASQLAKLLKK